MPFASSKCPVCGKLAESEREFQIGTKTVLRLKCQHVIEKQNLEVRDASSLISLDGKTLYKYQREGVEFIERASGRALIADEMGLGKTIQACGFLALHLEATPFVWIGKSTLKIQYLREILRWAGQDMFCQIIDSAKDEMIPGFKGYIVSYDLLRRFSGKEKVEDEFFPEHDLVKVTVKKNKLKEQMSKIGIKTVIIDECQQIKNPSSARTQSVRAICEGIDNIICLSGTPIKNNAAEYFSVLNILKPEMFPQYNRFISQHCDSYVSGYGYKVGGLRDPKGFMERTKSFIIRRERIEVMPDLPLISRTFQFCELGKDVEAAYKETMKKFLEYEDESEYDGTSAIEREANTLAYLSKMRHLTGLSKVNPCADFVADFMLETDRKITIFVHHKDVAQLLKSAIERAIGSDEISAMAKNDLFKVLTLDSSLNADQRSAVVDSFMSPTGPRILIASTLASGEGLNLQKCSDCIMLERQWNPANEEQAEGRFIRIGQTADKVTATYFVAVGTVDEFFAEIVERKREIVNKTLSGEAAKWDQSSIMRELTDVLRQKGGKKWGL